jgi:hypothetical protein
VKLPKPGTLERCDGAAWGEVVLASDGAAAGVVLDPDEFGVAAAGDAGALGSVAGGATWARADDDAKTTEAKTKAESARMGRFDTKSQREF